MTDSTTDQVTFTEAELLADHTMAEPLIAGGVRCHGGFDDEGTYVSPRTKFRVPAIEAWQAQHTALFGTGDARHPARDLARAHAQRRPGPPPHQGRRARAAHRHAHPHRHRRGLRRQHPPPPARRHAARTSRRTSAAPRSTTSARACSRPTAATRPAGRRRPATRTCGSPPATSPSRTPPPRSTSTPCSPAWASASPAGPAGIDVERALPDDIDLNLELIANLMIRVLLIEIQAFHTFAWAEEWLADPDLVAGDGQAADLVAYIRADETPHVGVPQDRPHRDARPHLGRAPPGKTLRRRRHDRHPLDPRARPVPRRRPRSRPARPSSARSSTGASSTTAAPTSWPSSTRWPPPTPPPPDLGPEQASGSRLRGAAQLSIGWAADPPATARC